jgi:hypothetical protein
LDAQLPAIDLQNQTLNVKSEALPTNPSRYDQRRARSVAACLRITAFSSASIVPVQKLLNFSIG